MPLTYDQLVKQEARLFYDALVGIGAHTDPRRFAHLYWRRLIEGWTLGDALADLNGGFVVTGAGGESTTPAPLGLDYETFLNEQAEVASTNEGGDDAGVQAHCAMRRLREGWTHDNLLRDLRGEPVEPPTPPPPVIDVPPMGALPPGPTSFTGRLWRLADGRPYLSTATHFMEMFSLWCRDEATCRQQITDLVQAYRVFGVVPVFRFLDTLGYYDYWRGREVSPIAFRAKGGYDVPATPGYYDKLHAMLAYLAARGALVRWSCGDTQLFGTGDQQIARMLDDVRQNAQVLTAVGVSVMELWEAGNETTLNGIETPAEARQYLQAFKAVHPQVLCGLGAPYGTEEPDELLAWLQGGDYSSVHGHRPADASESETTKTLRHIFSVRREGYHDKSPTVRICQMEPFGPGADVSGGRSDDVELLTLAAVLSHVTAQGWTYMSGNGVRWNGPIQLQPGFGEVLRATATLPPDLYDWHITRGGSDGNPFASASGYWGDAGVTEGPARVDSADNGSECVTVVYGGRGTTRVRAQRAMDGVVWNPATGERQPFVANRGDTITLSYRVGRVLLGNFR